MRRLITLAICLLASSGARSGASATMQPASVVGTVATAANAAVAVHVGREEPAADLAWTLPDPIVVASARRSVAPHSVRQHIPNASSPAAVVSEARTNRGKAAAACLTALAALRSGYRATGPPLDMPSLRHPLALPA